MFGIILKDLMETGPILSAHIHMEIVGLVFCADSVPPSRLILFYNIFCLSSDIPEQDFLKKSAKFSALSDQTFHIQEFPFPYIILDINTHRFPQRFNSFNSSPVHYDVDLYTH